MGVSSIFVHFILFCFVLYMYPTAVPIEEQEDGGKKKRALGRYLGRQLD
jgi:hypothetical protein